MIRRFFTIDRSCYTVPSREAFEDLQIRVVAAALEGAGLVVLPGFGDRTTSVLVTCHHQVEFEEIPVDDNDYSVSDSGVESLGGSSDVFVSFDY